MPYTQYTNLIKRGKHNVTANFPKNIIPHTFLANTPAHTSIRHHIEKGNYQQILNMIKDHNCQFHFSKVYSPVEDPKDQTYRNNTPIFDKVLKKRLSSTSLASNTFQQTLVFRDKTSKEFTFQFHIVILFEDLTSRNKR